MVLDFALDSPVDTLPLAGRDQGWGAFGPIGAKRHPHLASPVKGEVPFGGCGRIAHD
ncbi:hypothetical protein SAMN04488059_10381 [Devosia psychrophila]|uniref:Uncharacterized protein n=1 Tax=Devosia psychrophila TaxID=728005 RepID=A0A1I1HFZ6_9HYPH|nr:hypothetical protein SAMN04488059_10381 [Devosia psychrophila]